MTRFHTSRYDSGKCIAWHKSAKLWLIKGSRILFSCINWKTSSLRLRNFPMEDKCKLNFDLHVYHQLLNIQARISQFLSARAKEKIRKNNNNNNNKHTNKVNYETHNQRKTLDWTLYQALKKFSLKNSDQNASPREEKVWFSTDWVTKEAKNVFLAHGWKFRKRLFEKKNSTFYPFFQTLSPFSRLFIGLENWWGNFKLFSRIRDAVRTLCIRNWSSVVLLVVPASKKKNKNNGA